MGILMKKKMKKYANSIKATILHFGWFTLFIIPIFILINWAFFTAVNAQRQAIESRQSSNANREVDNIDLYINTRLASVHNDIHVIRDSNEAKAYIENPTDDHLTEFKNLLFRIATNKPEFIYASIINNDGQEIYKIKRINETLVVSPSSELIDISNESYFQRLLNLDTPALYVEELTYINGRPILALIAPVFTNDGDIQCFIKIDFDANQFLSVFELYLTGPENYLEFGIINNNHLWMIDKTNKELNSIDDQSQLDQLLSTLESDENVIRHDLEIYEDSHHYIYQGDQLFEFFVIIDMEAAIDDSQAYMLRYPMMIVGINLIVFAFIGFMAGMIRSKNDDRILLNANMYLSDQNIDAVIITDENLRITYVNHTFERFYGYSFKELENKIPNQVIGIETYNREFFKNITTEKARHIWNHSKSMIYVLKYLRIRREYTASGKTKHYLGIYSEPLIELDDYSKYIDQKDVIIADISKAFYKQHFIINQTCMFLIRVEGVPTEDFVLFIKKKLDDRYLIAIPKKEYVLIYINVEKHLFNQAVDMIDQLIEVYRHLPSTSNGFSHVFVVSQSNSTIKNLSLLIDSLMTALAYSKHKPQLKHHIYDEEMKAIIEREKQILNELETGFVIDEFFMTYQVQKDLNTGDILGVEALLRWENKHLGMIPPNDFIPIIENSFYINQLTPMVVHKVIKDFETHQWQLPKDFRISINLSHFDFNNDYIMDQILSIIDASALPANMFTFEITESNYMDSIEKTNRIIKLLHKRNILVAIDDFGTGYSSINSLKSINVDYVKIDKTFIINYPTMDNGQMFKTITQLVHGLNKEIIVEGTETEEQINYCIENQCKYAQGYYISKPIEIDDFIREFIDNKHGEDE
jgi:EAL domain-containing protein (putative c-di-GMP-specific phosphodiesterase class I)/PAS domain-containing protein